MKFKFKTKLTIKGMLWGLVIIGGLVVIALSVNSYYSNHKLIRGQRLMTEVILPLNSAIHGLGKSLKTFFIRKYMVAESHSPGELEKLRDRSALESLVRRHLKDMKAAADKSPGTEWAEVPERLSGHFSDILDADARMLDAGASLFGIRAELRRRKDALKAAAAQFQEALDALRAGDAGRRDAALTDLASGMEKLITAGYKTLYAESRADMPPARKTEMSETLGAVRAALERLRSDDAVQARAADSLKKAQAAADAAEEALTAGDDGLSGLRLKEMAEMQAVETLKSALDRAFDLAEKDIDVVARTVEEMRKRAERESAIISSAAKGVIIFVGIVAPLVMVLAGSLISRRILVPLKKASLFAETISNGDLTAEIEKDNDDEVGELVSRLSEMVHNLNALIGQVQRSGIQVTSSATELSATSKQQEAVMKTQLESTNYVVKSIGEISNVSADLVETMKNVAAMSDQTAEFANSGQSDLSQMEDAMQHMENASKSISEKLEAINEKAANITSVVTTITKVADQTNLLSLNAAIEAEKAGEYGRGFTVVAREIRRLADQTAVATLDIEQMVQEMQSAVSAGVMEMDSFIAEVQRSAENVGKISTQLTRIIQQVQALSPSFEGVNESMQFQSESAQKINASMLNLSEEMQQTVESLRESFMAIEQLNDAARGLQDEVSRFKVL